MEIASKFEQLSPACESLSANLAAGEKEKSYHQFRRMLDQAIKKYEEESKTPIFGVEEQPPATVVELMKRIEISAGLQQFGDRLQLNFSHTNDMPLSLISIYVDIFVVIFEILAISAKQVKRGRTS